MEFTAVPIVGSSKSHFRRRSPAVSTPLSTRPPKIGGGSIGGVSKGQSNAGGDSSGGKRFASPLTHPPASKPPPQAVVSQSWAAEPIDVDDVDQRGDDETPHRSSVGSSDDNFEPCLSMSRPRFAAADEGRDHRPLTHGTGGGESNTAAQLPPLAPQSMLQRKVPYTAASPGGVRRVLVVPDSDSDSDTTESDCEDKMLFASPCEPPYDPAAPRPVPLAPVPTPFTRPLGSPRGGSLMVSTPSVATGIPCPANDDTATSVLSMGGGTNASLDFGTPQSHDGVASPRQQRHLDSSTKPPTPIEPPQVPIKHETEGGSPRAASPRALESPTRPARAGVLDPQPSEPLGAISAQAPLPMRRRVHNEVAQVPILNVAAAPSIAEQQPDELLVVRRSATHAAQSPSSPLSKPVGSHSKESSNASSPAAASSLAASTAATSDSSNKVAPVCPTTVATLQPQSVALNSPRDDTAPCGTTTDIHSIDDRALSNTSEGEDSAPTNHNHISPPCSPPAAATATAAVASFTTSPLGKLPRAPTLPLNARTVPPNFRGTSMAEVAVPSSDECFVNADSAQSPNTRRRTSSAASSCCNAATSTDDLEPHLAPPPPAVERGQHPSLVDACTDVPDERQLTPSRSRSRLPSFGSSPEDVINTGMGEDNTQQGHYRRSTSGGGPHYTSKSASFNQPPREPYLVREPILALVNESLAGAQHTTHAAALLASKKQRQASPSQTVSRSNSREASRESTAGSNSSSNSGRFQTPVECQPSSARPAINSTTESTAPDASVVVEPSVSNPTNLLSGASTTSPLQASVRSDASRTADHLREYCEASPDEQANENAVANEVPSTPSATSDRVEESEFDGLPASLRDSSDPSPFRLRCSEGREENAADDQEEDVSAVRDALKSCLDTIRESIASQQLQLLPTSPRGGLKRRGSAPLIGKKDGASGASPTAAGKPSIPQPENFHEKIASPIERRRSSRLSKSQDRQEVLAPPPPMPPLSAPSFGVPYVDGPNFSPHNTSPVQGPLPCKDPSTEGGVSSEDRAALELQFQLEDLEQQHDKSIALSFPTSLPSRVVVVSPRSCHPRPVNQEDLSEEGSHNEDDDDDIRYQPAKVRISHAPRIDSLVNGDESHQRHSLRRWNNEQDDDERALDTLFSYHRTPRPACDTSPVVAAARIALHNPLPVSSPFVVQSLLGDYNQKSPPPVAMYPFQQRGDVEGDEEAAHAPFALRVPVSAVGRASSPRDDESDQPRLVSHVLPLSSAAAGDESAAATAIVVGETPHIAALDTVLAKLSPVPVYPSIFQDIVAVDSDAIEAEWREDLRSNVQRRHAPAGLGINKWGLLPCIVVGKQRPADMEFGEEAALRDGAMNTDVRALGPMKGGTPLQVVEGTSHSTSATPSPHAKMSAIKENTPPMVQLVRTTTVQANRQRPITAPVRTPQREQLPDEVDGAEPSAVIFCIPPPSVNQRSTIATALSTTSTSVEGSSSPTIRIPASPLMWNLKPLVQPPTTAEENAANQEGRPDLTAESTATTFTTSSPHFLRDHHLAEVHQRKKAGRLLLSPADEDDEGSLAARARENGSHESIASGLPMKVIPSFDELAARRREQRLKSIHAALGAIERSRPQRTTSPNVLHQRVYAAAVSSISQQDGNPMRSDSAAEGVQSAVATPRQFAEHHEQRGLRAGGPVTPPAESAFARDVRKVILGLKSSSAVVEGVAALRRQNDATGTVMPHAFVVAPSE